MLSGEALEDSFNTRRAGTDIEGTIARWTAKSEAARALHPCREVRYGEGPGQIMDVYPAPRAGAPIFMFIHGGAWRQKHRRNSGYAAPTFIGAGALYVSLGYDVIGEVGLPAMVEQTREAIAFLHREAEALGGDPTRLFVSGHSSGGHMAAMAYVTDWAARGLPDNAVKGLVGISGLYDLRPVVVSQNFAHVRPGEEAVQPLSPLFHVEHARGPAVLAHAEHDPSAAATQADDFAAALSAAGRAVERVYGKGEDHWTLPESLGDAASPLSRAALRLMGLG